MYQVETTKMRVQKRNGSYEEVSFDKILNRIKSLSQGSEFEKSLNIDETIIAQKVNRNRCEYFVLISQRDHLDF